MILQRNGDGREMGYVGGRGGGVICTLVASLIEQLKQSTRALRPLGRSVKPRQRAELGGLRRLADVGGGVLQIFLRLRSVAGVGFGLNGWELFLVHLLV